MGDPYHKRPEWSYSQMKTILTSGIDYAVAAKKGIIEQSFGGAVDLGQLAHMMVLGGEDTFAVSEFPDFRTKAAREWRDQQIAAGKNVITQSQFEAVDQIVNNVENHPLSQELLLGDGWEHEVEMYATTAEGVSLRGKADAIKVANKALVITDLKTTAKFDKFMWDASRNHYDLQTANYTLIGSSSQGIDPGFCNYYFCVAETVAPYRVQYFHASFDFIEAGERKLRRCIDAIVEFGDRQPTFLLPEVIELGDWSL